MKNPWILPVAALAVGAAGGYLSGKNTSSAPSALTSSESEARTRSSSRGEAAGGEGSKKSNRATSLADISRMPGNSSRLQAMMEFYAGLSPKQLEDEAKKLEGLPMSERMVASFLLFGRWAETDPIAAMEFSNTMGMAGGFVRPTILQSWASVDPANAAKYYSEHPREFAMMGMMGGGRGGPGGQSGASIIASEWARQDPAAAMAWAQGLTTGKSEAMTSVVSEIAKTDPRKATEMLAGFDAESKADAYRAVASQYGAKDFNEAQAWIRTLPADDQAAALASAINGLANIDPQKASQQVTAMADGDAKDRLVADIAGKLARQDPAAAADFVKAQTSEQAQRDSMRELMPTWTNQNPVAALAFANNLPQGDVRDSALQTYVWSNNTTAPGDLVKVAETITDEGDRNRAIGVAAMRWMREDEAAAKAYVESSTVLSDEAKQRITEGRGMWGGGGGPGGGGQGGARMGRAR